MVKDAKKQVAELAQQVGKHEARRLLISEGVSTSLADKLVGSRYPNEVGQLVKQAIERAVSHSKTRAS